MQLSSGWRAAGSFKAHRDRGYTLVELMIVVAMIGVLSALAIMGYRRYLLSAQSSEAKGVIQSIRNSEEAYKAETLVYLQCSASLTTYYPMAAPNSQKWAWRNPANAAFNCFLSLNVVTDGPVRFGYAVMAGAPGAVMPATSLNPAVVWPATTDPWYVVQAATDRDTPPNGVYAVFVSSSLSGEIMSQNETE